MTLISARSTSVCTTTISRVERGLSRNDVALDALPDGNGIDVCCGIRSKLPAIRCPILTSYDDEALYARS